MLALLGCFVWHQWRIKNGKTGVEPSHIIAFCLAGAALLMMAAAGAYIWQQFLQTQATSASSQASLPASYVNPLHEDSVKWKITRDIRRAIANNDWSADCRLVIVRLQIAYAEDYAADFKDITDVVGLKYDERFATGTLDKGISIRATESPKETKECAFALYKAVARYGRNRSGDSMQVGLRWLTEAEAPEAGCIEVNFGNDDLR